MEELKLPEYETPEVTTYSDQEILEDLRRQYPNYHTVLYGIGVCHGMKGQADEAIACLERAVELYSKAVKTVIPVSSCRVAEATKLRCRMMRASLVSTVTSR